MSADLKKGLEDFQFLIRQLKYLETPSFSGLFMANLNLFLTLYTVANEFSVMVVTTLLSIPHLRSFSIFFFTHKIIKNYQN